MAQAARTGEGGRYALVAIYLHWIIAALINMWIGVSRAGYTVAEELPILLVIVVVPGAAAAFLWWKYS